MSSSSAKYPGFDFFLTYTTRGDRGERGPNLDPTSDMNDSLLGGRPESSARFLIMVGFDFFFGVP